MGKACLTDLLTSLKEIFTLDPSTVRTGRRYFNLLFKAFMLIVTLACLVILNMAWSWLIDQSAKQLPISENTQLRLSQAGLVFLLAVSTAAILISIRDLVQLVWHELFDRKFGNEER